MNYRHAYHAGNFADVLKHAVLALVLQHLKQKPAPFRVIDTHAGIGTYDLGGDEALKTGEWRDGIGRLWDAELPPDVAALLDPYLQAVAAENSGSTLETYPGSPRIALTLMRRDDRLIANELHAEDIATLDANIGHDARAKTMHLDAWTALKSLLPPRERRGLVLIDPPFEQPDEFDSIVNGLAAAMRRFATGTYLVWYPVKDQRGVAAFRNSVARARYPKALSVELMIGATRNPGALGGCGLLLLNPPFTLRGNLKTLLPFFVQRLAQGDGAAAHVHWLGTDDDAAH
jgi:23S rRNA (adenine2030-N6)-methyltransferase